MATGPINMMQMNDKRITPIHDPWCGYWYKLIAPPPPPAPGYGFYVSNEGAIFCLDIMTLDYINHYTKRGAIALGSIDANYLYGMGTVKDPTEPNFTKNTLAQYTINADQSLTMVNEIILDGQILARNFCIHDNKIFILLNTGFVTPYYTGVTGKTISIPDMIVLDTVDMGSIGTVDSSNNGTVLKWNNDRSCFYIMLKTGATIGGSNLFEIDTSFNVVNIICVSTCIIGVGDYYYAARTVGWNDAWKPPTGIYWELIWLPVEAGTIKSATSWGDADGIFANAQSAEWDSAAKKYIIGNFGQSGFWTIDPEHPFITSPRRENYISEVYKDDNTFIHAIFGNVWDSLVGKYTDDLILSLSYQTQVGIDKEHLTPSYSRSHAGIFEHDNFLYVASGDSTSSPGSGYVVRLGNSFLLELARSPNLNIYKAAFCSAKAMCSVPP